MRRAAPTGLSRSMHTVAAMTGPVVSDDLRVHIEMFERALATLWSRPMSADTRSALATIRASWNVLADAAFGPIDRSRACAWCGKSSVQPGPRCAHCWHRLADACAL